MSKAYKEDTLFREKMNKIYVNLTSEQKRRKMKESHANRLAAFMGVMKYAMKKQENFTSDFLNAALIEVPTNSD